MNKTKIEWCDYTWNPVVGCKRGCTYCYARRINDRFKIIPHFDTITLKDSRLCEPAKLKKPSVIFANSMSDPQYWDTYLYHKVANAILAAPQHAYVLLSKHWPNMPMPNAWQGYTLTSFCQLSELMKIMLEEDNDKFFLNYEPLQEPIELGRYFEHIPFIIVGAMTGPGAVVPKREWLEQVEYAQAKYDLQVFYKDNIIKHFPDLKSNINPKKYFLCKK